MQDRALNCRVVIESEATGQDSLGQPNGTWSTFATVWANIRYGSGSEAIRAGAVTTSAQVSIRIRYRTDITSAMRVTYAGVTYQILAVLPDMTKRDFTDLVCEVVA